MHQPRLVYENPMRRPAGICQFSGCTRIKDRRVGNYDLCKKHADNLERNTHAQGR